MGKSRAATWQRDLKRFKREKAHKRQALKGNPFFWQWMYGSRENTLGKTLAYRPTVTGRVSHKGPETRTFYGRSHTQVFRDELVELDLAGLELRALSSEEHQRYAKAAANCVDSLFLQAFYGKKLL
jgi:hypothetical protein